ncbi:hypothetical protein ColTof3_04671 [Colletotrichum tofieldiae]|nr:hypothetical protein ColTof3_04671 [Colletotrichum tofieldiae]
MVSWVIFGFCRWHASSKGDVAAPSDGDLKREIKVFQRGRDTAFCQWGTTTGGGCVLDDKRAVEAREVRRGGFGDDGDDESSGQTAGTESGFTAVWGIES